MKKKLTFLQWCKKNHPEAHKYLVELKLNNFDRELINKGKVDFVFIFKTTPQGSVYWRIVQDEWNNYESFL